ncbi:NifB/NifX family molybdenum-iron cluster-binding protein [Staphylothermus hellenicus]|uniref:Dinitrogenase iron-molybdenum cofactor biosynthesis protein n=1 Tax=Staphylothermus hellenicus (strain DSM 12710 / JCM 10830 / BK20S6-10-b1 / P8) TaxID=591019 RepID=D7DAN9_STAHD|nr:NifB/NifX family molybdenum-iron cluster-binding protein [Staphylothermus hellenicus]ADI31236.1 Dinitrogenase iron-molybdenum cofactor biosynthesis protein [Staphylothermus hellenicus DSM 12710]
MVKIAFPTDKGGLDDYIYDRFGRTPTFTIVEVEDSEIKNVKIVENPGHKAGSGAGIKAVQKLIEEKIDVVAGPNPGPNSYMALQQSNIKVVTVLGLKVKDAIEHVIKQL